MKRFTQLYDEIDRTTSTNEKVAALVRYLSEAPPADAAWALFFLTGRRLKRHLATRLMHAWALELTGLPEWLVEECYGSVGDFAETIAGATNQVAFIIIDERSGERTIIWDRDERLSYRADEVPNPLRLHSATPVRGISRPAGGVDADQLRRIAQRE